MPVNHHVLLRFNMEASQSELLYAAEILGIKHELTDIALTETELKKARKFIFGKILDKICALKELINGETKSNGIIEAKWSENIATVAEDRALTSKAGVSHKIEMLMQSVADVEIYFNHPAHLQLVSQFVELEKRENSIFLPGGFAIPFDTRTPLTPRTVKDQLERGDVVFRSPEDAKAWALCFAESIRDGGFLRKADLKKVASQIEESRPDIAEAIRTTFTK